ncbi:FMN-binding glutamate synthase family protein [Yeosuana marina]|uniref:FMN-binding glutamate synthase family protein n=1 Tax=Yeosuana marina TaxID=1565536 RepID=UPI0030EE5D86|tara:strand:- start:1703 stop:3202 length:1500 start_codon:yes stop_codon:yes gene_type:complete
MREAIKFTIISLVIAAFIIVVVLWPLPGFILLAGLIIFLGFYDMFQKKHTILRNFPVIGHMRYLLELIGPEIHQYFIESDTDGKPIDRNHRSYIYQRAKQQSKTHPFGTELDVYNDNYKWMQHSIYPAKKLETPTRVIIGGSECKQPYSASLFNISAMSYGALSKNAIEALNLGAKAGNFFHDTGEGGISEYHRKGGDLVWEIGTGYFGCRTEDGNFDAEKFKEKANWEEVKMIEVKISQGAKPGHGGVLPAAKNNDEIAEIRGVKPHTDVLSPPGHSAFNDAQGLLVFVQQLRELSNGKPVGFKLAIGSKKEFIEICESMLETGIKPDFITVDGAEGGTGAAPIDFSNYVGMPWEDALLFVTDTLCKYDLKKDIKVITATKIFTAFDIFKALCIGADVCNSARGMMLALGCIQALRCNTNECPTGVATNNPRLVKGLVISEKWKRVKNYHENILEEFLELLAASGCKTPDELNRSLIFKKIDKQWKSYEEEYATITSV